MIDSYTRYHRMTERVEFQDGKTASSRTGPHDGFVDHPAPDDQSELYALVRKGAEKTGMNVAEYLDRLREVEDEGWQLLAAWGHTQDEYDSMMADVAADRRHFFDEDND